MTKTILGCLLLLLAVSCHAWAENVVLSPTGSLWTVCEEEGRRVRASVGRFADVHRRCRDLLRGSGVEVDGLSFIWYAPYFGYSEFASVFWETNRIVVATVVQKDCNVRTYPVPREMSFLRTQLEMSLENYRFVCPLGGDGNVSEIGVVVGGAEMRCFSLQTGYAFRKNKSKLFCGTRESVAAYEHLIRIDDFLRSLSKKKCTKEFHIAFDGEK